MSGKTFKYPRYPETLDFVMTYKAYLTIEYNDFIQFKRWDAILLQHNKKKAIWKCVRFFRGKLVTLLWKIAPSFAQNIYMLFVRATMDRCKCCHNYRKSRVETILNMHKYVRIETIIVMYLVLTESDLFMSNTMAKTCKNQAKPVPQVPISQSRVMR